ncbi:hypothetical protein HELRODRAFT_194225 [Helobdella robusta]|uniref:Sugar transporter SWEET n=1 Tax=Helobdella robusta TaxID=6412 RepID=T1FVU1_HELRO|nr:hypothetical protein HELRODRAFT_194225 [Helobdella robusta]ESN92524.1 hypothetical protein HELRODRAFT_194225 [Helobdella robusta]
MSFGFGELLENFTIGLTLILHLSGLSACQCMVRSKSTKGVPYLIFIFSTISCIIMIKYACILEQPKLIFLNSVGLVLYVIYISLYLMYADNKAYDLAILGSLLAVPISLLFFTSGWISANNGGDKNGDGDASGKGDVLNVLGSALTINALFLISIPSIEVYHNLVNRNREGMPLVMIISGLACFISWLAYGIMLNDIFIYLPNGIGMMVQALKLYAFVAFDDDGGDDVGEGGGGGGGGGGRGGARKKKK